MKISAQEEYGLRCLLRLASAEPESMTLPEISAMEGLSVPYVAKLMAALRDGEIEEDEFVVGSISVKYRSLNGPFGEGTMQLTLFGDYIDGVMWARWQEQRPDTRAVLEFDYEWSTSDPAHRLVEISILNPEDLIDPSDYLPTNGQIEMSKQHERFLRRRLSQFYWLKEHN